MFQELQNQTPAIEIRNLSKYYGKARGVIDVNLNIEEGDFYGFIGPNGAGKSTAIRVLLGLIRPTEGEAHLFGTDVRGKGVRILKDIGYMPAEAIFYSGMQVKEILKLSAKLHGLDCTTEAAKLCERLELDVAKRVDELSFGNRKKVSIVCALQHNPRLCILDEPTSGLDPLMQREFFALLEERNRQGTTIFLSSHILSEVQRYCRNAAIISAGRILVADSLKNLSHTSVKRVSISPAVTHDEKSMKQFEKTILARLAVDSAKDVQIDDRIVSFLYSGDVSTLVQVIATLPVSDVNISEPPLDEIFLHYYEHGVAETVQARLHVSADMQDATERTVRSAERGNMAGDVGRGGEE